jgi:hypothetical protein
MHLKSRAKYLALAVAAFIASSCDTRLPTQVSSSSSGPSADVERPVITFAATGAVNGAVPFGKPISLNVKVTDNVGVSTVQTSVRNGAVVVKLDTVTIKPTVPSVTRTVDIPLTGLKKTDRLVVRTTATDAASNTRVDSTVITFASPNITIIKPTGGTQNVGDSLYVEAHVTDAAGISSISIVGYTLRGSADLGTQTTNVRYPVVSVPAPGSSFVPGDTDVIIRRWLKPLVPIDSLTDSLIVTVTAVDALGGVDTARVMVKMVRGPSVQVISPVVGDSATRGAGLTITLRAHDLTGVKTLGFTIKSDASFPTRVVDSGSASYSSAPTDTTFTKTILVPANAPSYGILTVTPFAKNTGDQAGASAPFTIAVRGGLPAAPRVYQAIASRVETGDSFTITATGNGISIVGYELRDSNVVIRRDSAVVKGTGSPALLPSTFDTTVALKLPPSARGKRITLRSFAYDQDKKVGYSIPAGTTTSQGVEANAFKDTALVVFGTTYALPGNRSGAIGDIVVDSTAKNVFLSNINFGRLEVWRNSDSTFDATGIPVASQPWGLAMSVTEPSTIYVGNSGGTSISRVITTPSNMHEDLPRRIRTRPSFIFTISEQKDETGKIRFTVVGPAQFSDRLQYIAQSTSGRLYFSTKPTSTASKGTIRYLDAASGPAPDMRFMLNYARRTADQKTYTVLNVDDIQIHSAKATSSSSDTLFIYDHPSGDSTNVSFVAFDTTVAGAVAKLQAQSYLGRRSDVDIGTGIDVESIGLTDTTFMAVSGNHDWISFGEGHSGLGSRVMLYKDTDPTATRYQVASPGVLIQDLSNNASDVVFGLALDKTGNSLAVHGIETFFALVGDPFQLRLQGKKSTFNQGAGVAFNPDAQGVNTAASADRVAYVASANGTIEMVDAAYYDFSRGVLPTKANLYGPLRAVKNFHGPGVVTLFGLSSKGLVVIDVQPTDMLGGPDTKDF